MPGPQDIANELDENKAEFLKEINDLLDLEMIPEALTRLKFCDHPEEFLDITYEIAKLIDPSSPDYSPRSSALLLDIYFLLKNKPSEIVSKETSDYLDKFFINLVDCHLHKKSFNFETDEKKESEKDEEQNNYLLENILNLCAAESKKINFSEFELETKDATSKPAKSGFPADNSSSLDKIDNNLENKILFLIKGFIFCLRLQKNENFLQEQIKNEKEFFKKIHDIADLLDVINKKDKAIITTEIENSLKPFLGENNNFLKLKTVLGGGVLYLESLITADKSDEEIKPVIDILSQLETIDDRLAVLNFKTSTDLIIASESIDLLEHILSKNPDLKKSSPIISIAICNDFNFKRAALNLIIKKTEINLSELEFNGVSAIRMAAGLNDYNFLSLLLKNNPDTNLENKDGFTALHTAIINGRNKNAKLLLSYKAEVDKPDKQGNTPLHLALRNSRKKIAINLFYRNAKLDIKNQDGQNVLEIALTMEIPERIKKNKEIYDAESKEVENKNNDTKISQKSLGYIVDYENSLEEKLKSFVVMSKVLANPKQINQNYLITLSTWIKFVWENFEPLDKSKEENNKAGNRAKNYIKTIRSNILSIASELDKLRVMKEDENEVNKLKEKLQILITGEQVSTEESKDAEKIKEGIFKDSSKIAELNSLKEYVINSEISLHDKLLKVGDHILSISATPCATSSDVEILEIFRSEAVKLNTILQKTDKPIIYSDIRRIIESINKTALSKPDSENYYDSYFKLLEKYCDEKKLLFVHNAETIKNISDLASESSRLCISNKNSWFSKNSDQDLMKNKIGKYAVALPKVIFLTTLRKNSLSELSGTRSSSISLSQNFQTPEARPSASPSPFLPPLPLDKGLLRELSSGSEIR